MHPLTKKEKEKEEETQKVVKEICTKPQGQSLQSRQVGR